MITDNLRRVGLAILLLVVISAVLFGPFSESLYTAIQQLLSVLFEYGYEASAINSAKATTLALSCTGMMNMHGGSPGDTLQTEWGQQISDKVPYSCEAAAQEGVVIKQSEDDTGVVVDCDPLNSQGECRIHRFELPQDKPGSGWADYIVGLGHPRYLLYYEAFPHGPANAWERIDENLGAMTIAMGAVTNVVFFGAGKVAGKVVGGTGKVIGDLAPGALLRSGDDIAEVSRFKRVRNFMVRKVGLADEAIRATDDSIAKNALGGIVARRAGSDVLENIGTSNARQLMTRLRNYRRTTDLVQKPAGDIADDVGRILDDYMPPNLRQDAKEEMSLDLALALRGADEVQAGRGAASAFSSTTEYWQKYATSYSLADDIVTSSSRSEMIQKVADLADKGDDTLSAFSRVDLPQGLSRSQVWDKAKFVACRSRAWRYALIQNADNVFGSNDKLELAAQLAGVASLSTGNLCGGYSMPTSYTQQLSTMASATKIGVAGASVLTGYMATKIQSKSQMYQPQGINSIVLKAPFTTPRVYEMHPYANYYYISLIRKDFGQHNKRRFYLVSPFTTRNLDSDDPHLVTEHEPNLECKTMDEDSSGGAYVHTQPEWNGGATESPMNGWNNRIFVQTPADPNTENVPGKNAPDVLSAAGNGIKKCTNPGMLDDLSQFAPWVDNRDKVDSLQVNHQNMRWQTSDGNPNYGYDSGDWDEAFLRWTVLGATIAVDVLITGASLGAATPVALAFTGASYAFVNHHIDQGSYWPEH